MLIGQFLSDGYGSMAFGVCMRGVGRQEQTIQQPEGVPVLPNEAAETHDTLELGTASAGGAAASLNVPQPPSQELLANVKTLVDAAKRPAALLDSKLHAASVQRIYDALTKEPTTEKLRYFSQIRKELLDLRLKALMEKRFKEIRGKKLKSAPKINPTINDQLKSIAIAHRTLPPKDQELRSSVLRYAEDVVENKHEKKFRLALKSILNLPVQLKKSQLKTLYYVIQAHLLGDDYVRGLINQALKEEFNNPEYDYSGPIEALIQEIEKKAERLRPETLKSETRPTIPVTRLVYSPKKQLAALKKSRVIPYEILEPHEALLRERPELIEKLTEVRRKDDQFPEGFVQSLPPQIQTAIMDWFSKPKAQRAKELREIAKKRAELVRAQMVMPSEIARFLESSGLELKTSTQQPVNIKNLSKALARKILDTIENPQKYAQSEHGIRLFENDERFNFPVFNAQNRIDHTESIQLPVGLWVKPAQDGKSIELGMVGAELGQGGFNTVYQFRPLQIDLSSQDHQMAIQKKVLRQAMKRDGNSMVASGAQLFMKLPESLRNNVEFRAVKPSEKLTRMNPQGTMETQEEEYAGDMRKLLAKFNDAQKSRLLSQVARTLELTHQAGWVHRDIKPENILIREHFNVPEADPARYEAFVADWDLMSSVGPNTPSGTPEYFDSMAISGLATPLTDIYALSVMAKKVFEGRMPQILEAPLRTLEKENGGVKNNLWKERYKKFKPFLEAIKSLGLTGPKK